MTATNWNTPGLTDAYADFLDFVKLQLEHLGTMDFADDTNIPTNFKRCNPTTEVLEKYTGASWTPTTREAAVSAHMADNLLHGSLPVGATFVWWTGTPPLNCFFLDGVPKSRSDYATLFALWGSTFGVGDGSSTFGIPDMRGYLPIGKSSTSPASGNLGTTFGNLNHVHTGPSHTHTVAAHSHGMEGHTHTGGAHTHSTPDHSHTVPAHYHAATGNGATINITSSASHQHNYGTKSGSTIAGSGGNRALIASSSGANETNQTSNDGTGAHVHANANFAGHLGNVNSGINGDGTMGTGTANGGNTGSGGAVATGGPNIASTESIALTSDAAGTGNTGTGNPPCVIVNWCVKAL